MAEQRGQKWYPTYYNVGNKRILLRSDWTWQQNVWHFIDITVGIFLAKAKVWSYERELIEELEQTCKLRTYLRLKDIVHRGLYAHNLSFYLNCRSCAWAAVSNVIAIWKHYAVDVPALTVDIDATITGQSIKSDDLSLGDTLATHKVAKLRTHADTLQDTAYKYGKRHTLEGIRPGERGYVSAWIAITESEWDYYLQSCDEFGIEPISKDEFIQRNFPEDGRTSSEKLRNYKREWARKHKQKKKEQG